MELYHVSEFITRCNVYNACNTVLKENSLHLRVAFKALCFIKLTFATSCCSVCVCVDIKRLCQQEL